MENRKKTLKSSNPLRSGSVPASSPWSLNATMIISMSRCQGLLPRKNHQKTRVVYQGQFTHQKIHQVVATKKTPWNPRSVNATMIIPTYNFSYWGLQTNLQLGGLTLKVYLVQSKMWLWVKSLVPKRYPTAIKNPWIPIHMFLSSKS